MSNFPKSLPTHLAALLQDRSAEHRGVRLPLKLRREVLFWIDRDQVDIAATLLEDAVEAYLREEQRAKDEKTVAEYWR